MPNEPATEAITAFNALIAGITFPTLTDSITDTSFDLPDTSSGILYDAPAAVSINTLTDTNVGGLGNFDKIMTALRNHLVEEYDQGRITGREYAEVYQAVTAAALGNAVQFTLTAGTTQYQNALLQMQARAAEHQALTARASAVTAKYGVVSAIAESENMKAQYALTKMQIAVQDISYSNIEQQVILTTNQAASVNAEKLILDYQLANILPEEKRQLTYTIDNILTEQYNKLNYEVDVLLVDQHSLMTQDINIKTFQHTDILPAQKNVLLEQYEVQRAQTLDTRSDNTTAVAGAIGKQKDLYTEQISSYVKDARYKAAKFWVDGWITQKSLDEGLNAPNEFTNTQIDEVLVSLKGNLSLD
jgi:hypothetical protein